MREILFRGKRANNVGWIEGDLLHDYWMHGDVFLPFAIRYKINGIYSFPFPVIPETVGQFTGLRDKNGKKIFEGDICKVTYYNHSSPNTILQQTVIYSSGTFALQSKDFEPFDIEDTRRYVPLYYMLPPNNIEIIGNIHDNKEERP